MQKYMKKAKEVLSGKGTTIALAVLVLFVLVAIIVPRFVGGQEEDQDAAQAEVAVVTPAAPAAATSEATTSPSPTSGGVLLSPSETQAPTKQLGSWMKPAEEVARAWGNIGAGKEAWLEGLKPYMDSDTFKLYEQMNIDALKQRELTEVRQSVTSGEWDQVAVDAYYDGDTTTPVMRMIFVPKNDGSYELAMITSPE